MTSKLAAAVAIGAVLTVAAPARAADIVSPAGACTATATWKTGGFTKTSATLTSADIIEIPRADVVSWKGGVTGPAAGTSRTTAGRVSLGLPAPFGAIDLADWQGAATDLERSGSYDYNLPAIVPAGVVMDLQASHDENGKRHCSADVGVIIAGGAFDSPLIWVAIAGLIIFAGLLVLLGRMGAPAGVGRIIGGALLGLPFGLFLGLILVLFGLVPLASPMVTILLVFGVVAGAGWTRWSPIRRPA